MPFLKTFKNFFPYRASVSSTGSEWGRSSRGNGSALTKVTSRSESRQPVKLDSVEIATVDSQTPTVTFADEKNRPLESTSFSPKSVQIGYADEEEPEVKRTDVDSEIRAARKDFFNWTNAKTEAIPTPSEAKPSGLIFLQYQGETKRIVSTEQILTLEDLKCLFLKSFPNLPNDYIRAPHVTIYIQDPSKQEFFYELDDLRDLKDRAVLKLHEQPLATSTPATPVSNAPIAPKLYDSPVVTPVTNTPHIPPSEPIQTPITLSYSADLDDMNYFSEPEYDYSRNRTQMRTGLSSSVSHSFIPSSGKRYGTLDSYYKPISSEGPPPKPTRNFASPLGKPISGARSPLPQTVQSGRTPYSGASGPNTDVYGQYKTQQFGDTHSYGSASERSASISRSGSVTPIIDEEARYRMDHMEKQLASLSSLVHASLMSQGGMHKSMTDSVYKDIQELRKEILGSDFDAASDAGSFSRLSDVGSDRGSLQYDRDAPERVVSPTNKDYSYPAAFMSSGSMTSRQLIIQLKKMKKTAVDLRVEQRNLRRTAQSHASATSDILRDAFERIKVILNTNKNLNLFASQAQMETASRTQGSTERVALSGEQDKFRSTMGRLEQDLSSLEVQIEDLRQHVIGGNRKLRVSEVEMFTESLTNVGRTAANIKSQFPQFQNRMKNVMSAEMEKVVREEKFLKDEPERIDNVLRRCKKLTNTVVTMKKLAMVQDSHTYGSERYGSPSGPHIRPPSAPPYLSQSYKDKLDIYKPMSPSAKTDARSFLDFPITTTATSVMVTTESHTVSSGADRETKIGVDTNNQTSVLDSLLEELQTVSRSASTSTLTQSKLEKKAEWAALSGKSNGSVKPDLSLNFGEKYLKPTEIPNSKSEPDWLSNRTDTNGQRISPSSGGKDEFSTPPSSPTKKAMPPVYGRVMESENRSNLVSSPVWPYNKPVSNGGLMRSQSEATNAFSYGSHMPVEPNSFPSSQHYQQRQSLSPTAAQQQRSRSGTPTSITSEPPLSYNKRVPMPPAPPVRTASSSRIYADPTVGSWKPNSSFYQRYASGDLQSLKSQLTHDYSRMSAKSDFSLPIVQTNAVDMAEDIRLSDQKLKSGSSSESVNSQKGVAPPAIPPSPAKVAPPPPPRTKDSTATLERQKKFFP